MGVFDEFDSPESNNNLYYEPPRRPERDGVEALQKTRKTMLIISIVMAVLLILTVVLCAVISSVVVKEQVNDALKEYKRYYYLPEDYSSATLSVISSNLDSVLEISCTSSSNSNVSGKATGFIISDDGYVITNCHVVTYEYSTGGWFNTVKTGTYDTIIANFIEGSTLYKSTGYRLELLYTDSRNDLALLRFSGVKPETIKPLTFCDSDMLTMGEETVVIGNAQGYGLAVTNGIVSSPYRKFADSDSNGEFTVDVFQTDAALNPGNSGGPVCNMYGQVIGVATFKIADTENEGLGFGILSNVVIDFIERAESAKGIEVNYKVA